MQKRIVDNLYPMLVGLIYTLVFGFILSSKTAAAIGLGIGLVTGKYQAKKKAQDFD